MIPFSTLLLVNAIKPIGTAVIISTIDRTSQALHEPHAHTSLDPYDNIASEITTKM